MSTPDGQGSAPWRAYDIGTTDVDGNRTFRGLIFFDNATCSNLEPLSNAEALYIIKPNDKQPTVRMWLWE